MANNNDIDIVVKVDAAQAQSTLKQLGDDVKTTGDKAEQAGGGFSKFQANIVSVQSSIQIAKDAFNALSRAMSGIASTLQEGARVDDITSSFEKLAYQAGASGDTLLRTFGASLGNTIPKVEEMRIANELLIGGIDPSKFEMLGKAARSLAEATGTSAAEGLEKLNDSLLRGNTRALKSLGIIIDDTKAMEEFARAHGGAAEDLNDLGRAAAIQEASIKALTEAQGRLGEVTDDAGDRIDQFTSGLTDAHNEIAKGLANNAELNKLLDDLNVELRNIDWQPLIDGIATFVGWMDKLTATLAEGVQQVPGFFGALSDAVSSGLALVNSELDKSTSALERGYDQLDKMKAKSAAIVAPIKSLAGSFSELEKIDTLLNPVNQSINNMTVSVTKADASLRKVSSAGGMPGAFFGPSKSGKAFADDIKKQRDELDQFMRKVREMTDPTSGINAVASELQDLVNAPDITATEWEEGLKAIAEKAQDAKIPLNEVWQLIDKMTGEHSIDVKVHVASDEELSEIFGTTDGSQSTGSGDSTGAIDFTQFGYSSDQSEGFNQAGEQIGQDVMDGITDYFANKCSEEYAKNGQMIGGGIGSAIGAYFGGAAGAQIGGQLGGVIGTMIAGLIGEESEWETEKKTIDKYFCDLFDNNRITAIVDGQMQLVYENFQWVNKFVEGHMQVIDDLQFDNPNMQAHWDAMGAAAQNTFSAIGAAWEQILNDAGIDTEKWAGELGKVFAQNLGGDISNLRVMLKAAGKDAAELGAALMKAFLQGKMSAKAYMDELRAIQSTMDKGLARSVESVGEEWKKIEEAGWSGGAALTGAISDIGAAAYQMGARTFPQLAEIMQGTFGISADKVQMFMQAMAIAGVTSLEQLAKASDDVLAAIAANMEALSKGETANYKPITLDTSTNTNTGSSSRGISSGESAADKAKKILEDKIAKLKETEEAIRSVLVASTEWKEIEDELKEGIISTSDAEKARLDLRARIKAALEAQSKAEKQLAEDAEKQAKGHKVSTETLLKHEAALKAATDLVDSFTQSTEDNAKAIAATVKPVLTLKDAIYNLGALGTLNGGDALNDYLAQFGGDLNALQVAVNGLGGSFESMKDQAIASFLAGKTSAQEAMKAIQDSGQGIADVTGGVALAIQNMKEHGTKGGRFTLDDLKDIAAEAKELGASTLDDIARTAMEQGISQSEVQSIMLALQDNGVKTLDELLNASDETAIKIVGKLDQLKFPFQATNDETTRLLAQLEELKNKDVTVPVKLFVSTEYANSATQNIVNNSPALKDTPIAGGSYGKRGDGPGIPSDMRRA